MMAKTVAGLAVRTIQDGRRSSPSMSPEFGADGSAPDEDRADRRCLRRPSGDHWTRVSICIHDFVAEHCGDRGISSGVEMMSTSRIHDHDVDDGSSSSACRLPVGQLLDFSDST